MTYSEVPSSTKSDPDNPRDDKLPDSETRALQCVGELCQCRGNLTQRVTHRIGLSAGCRTTTLQRVDVLLRR
ncbi:hypothetical protein GOSPT_025_00180 [Gordonia sputi NBRC 100414]|uniref:Uncharacterized protein n=1 Tax=Gordonia sputi NBRC 100414 TaxID=1089453 RepID=H5TWX6_9ACTN|nr:hypothetical protein GOSPT_025_00180 [Gordonia sputi NBRC 100414]